MQAPVGVELFYRGTPGPDAWDWHRVEIKELLLMDAFVTPDHTSARQIVEGMTYGVAHWLTDNLRGKVYIEGWTYSEIDGEKSESRDRYTIRCQKLDDATLCRLRWT